MNYITLGSVTYPSMVTKNTTPDVLNELVRREEEFEPSQVRKCKDTLEHLKKGQVVFVPLDTYGLYLTSEQLVELDQMD